MDFYFYKKSVKISLIYLIRVPILLTPFASQKYLKNRIIKTQLHPRNRHRAPYDFTQLVKICPALRPFVFTNPYGTATINFFDPAAVKLLNRALLQQHYDLQYWDIPAGYLCPPIPGRADYLHYLADLLAEKATNLQIPTGDKIRVLDIGTGANLIYPIIGQRTYQWSFVGADIDQKALANAQVILDKNPVLTAIELRLQPDPKSFFKHIIRPNEYFAAVICNPPFYASAEAAQQATQRKIRHLKGKKTKEKRRNFGGQANELWCKGGEAKFIKRMIRASVAFGQQVGWFTTLVAKNDHLQGIAAVLKKVKTREMRTIEMGQGNKRSRVVAWRF